jgi:SAM-dependent methyltransferase
MPLSPLQEALPERMLTRGYKDVAKYLDPVFESYLHSHGFHAEVLRRMHASSEWPPEVTVLDVGCGSGAAIEELARVLPLEMEDYRASVRIKAIGIDSNPLPHMIPRTILRINPRTGVQMRNARNRLLADIHPDDAETLATIPDQSVDILLSSNCLEYLRDPLRSISSGWRVLKEGGVMAWWSPGFLRTVKPSLTAIVEKTPHGTELFEIRSLPSVDRDEFEPDVLVGRKKTGVDFSQFPYRLKDSKALSGPFVKEPHYAFAQQASYSKIR